MSQETLTTRPSSNETIEIDLLLEAIYLKYGYDFRGYARSSVERRIDRALANSGLSSISQMQHRVLNDQVFFESLLLDLSINVTEMFRDPPFFAALREHLLPVFADRSAVKIWHAGCATGEEVYSTAILLHEAGLIDRARIYATDFNEVVLAKAREGILPIDRVRNYTSNYQQAGGQGSFADYYTARHGLAIISPELKRNIVFADHNLVTDGVFAEVDIVICRNVMIYFGRELQDRALRLFRDSLSDGGFLCLGSKETIMFSQCADDFQAFVNSQRIYRKKEAER